MTGGSGGSGGDATTPGQGPLSKIVHDLANPLSAVLAETQLLLLDADNLTPEAVASLRAIEEAALRMRVVLGESSGRRWPVTGGCKRPGYSRLLKR